MPLRENRHLNLEKEQLMNFDARSAMNVDLVEGFETGFETAPDSLLTDLLGQGELSAGLRSVMPADNPFRRPTSVMGTEADDFLQSKVGDTRVLSGGGNDALLVAGGNNVIFTTEPVLRGRFERDYLNVGEGRDVIFLGDEAGSYYLADGWLDSVYIDGFDTSEDTLMLHGSSELYAVESSDQGSWIMWGQDSSTAVAYLSGVADFDLESRSVSYLIKEVEPEPVQEPDPIPEPTLEPEVGSEELPFSREFYLQLGVPEYETVAGGPEDDLLVGGGDADLIAGFAGRDYAFGGGGGDLFILGSLGGTHYAEDGWFDSVYIDDFTANEDQIQLQGSASDYSVTTGETGSWLYYQGDAIAYLNNVTTVDLNSFDYLAL